MNEKPHVQRKRHVAKAITWRLIGTLDTWLISWFLLSYIGEVSFFAIEFSNEVADKATHAATYIAILELISKTVLYYFHERVWYNISWAKQDQQIRHIIKTISWRLIGALDTILLVLSLIHI